MYPFFLEYIDDFWHNARHCYGFYNDLGGEGEGIIIFGRPIADGGCRKVNEGGAILILDYGYKRRRGYENYQRTAFVNTKPKQ